MNLQQFAEKYRLKIKKDSCDDLIIPGRVKGAKRVEDNHHILEYQGRFEVYLTFPTVGRWNSARKKLEAAGAHPVMSCKHEGFLIFDPENEPLVKLVLKLARIRVKRQLTEEQKAEIRGRFAKKS